MKKGEKVEYEWCLEWTDVYGDIQDHSHSSTLEELRKPYEGSYETLEGDKCTPVICLIRDVVSENSGVEKRAYCYFDEPEFDNGIKVPKKYLREYSQFREGGV